MTGESMVQSMQSQKQKLSLYLDELYRWNGRVNLTAVPRAEAEQRHVAEAASLMAAAAPAPGAAVVDVGSGAGIPGLLMALERPDVRMALVEADVRKAAFLRHVAGLLGLRSVTVIERRAEDVGRDPAHRERYDLAVSRAVAPAGVLCELCLPLVRVGGHLLALVSDATGAAVDAAPAAVVLGGGEPRPLSPGILEVLKLRETEARWPRAPGVARRRPLRG